MSIVTILIIVLLIFAIFGAPAWPYARSWGYGWGPSGMLGLVVVVLIILLLIGYLPH